MDPPGAPARPFPGELLVQSAQARKDYFAGKIVAHPRLQEIYQQVLATIRDPAGAGLIFVYGPSGVGKTTLWRRVQAQLGEEARTATSRSAGARPVVGLEVAAPDSGQ